MSLDVEDGSGKSTADAYASIAEADAYHSARGNSAWSGTDADKEIAIVKATAWLDARYRNRWKGRRAHEDQRLAWPRRHVRDSDGYLLSDDFVPREVIEATCEAASRLLSGSDLYPDVGRGDFTSSETVGSLSVTYMGGAPAGDRYPYIDALLSGLASGGASIQTMRA